MKVHILLKYSDDKCRVVEVYTKRESADLRAKNENRRNSIYTHHVITKTLKGKLK